MVRSLCLFATFCAFAASTAKVDDVIATVRTGLQRKQSDSHIAGELRKLDLGEHLDWLVIEQLESEGAGPKTIAGMEMLVDESEGLPAPKALAGFPTAAAPSASEEAFALAEAARNSLNYAATLPDFICTESVRRYEDMKRKEKQNWTLKDTLTLQLSYFGHVEDYKLTTVNGKRTYRSYEEMGGAESQGEFGSLLLSIFRDAPRSRFAWDHWTTLRRRRTHVYRFHIGLEESTYNVQFASSWQGSMTARTGQHGFIYVDAESNRVVRVYADADSIPPDFPVTNVYTLLDYDFVDVGGHAFLLPIRALVRMGTNRVQTRNEMAFESYRKFSSDANITFK
jgi:hypothetical protein